MELFVSHRSTPSFAATLAAKVMIATVEPKHRSHHHLPRTPIESSEGVAVPFVEVKRVPDETPAVMRPQPTPALMAPFRWSVWRTIALTFVNLFRLPKPVARLQRD